MQADSILKLGTRKGAIFVDNLMIASADRLLQSRYSDLAELPGIHDPELGVALVHHDLFNLAQLVESLVCHDAVYVNGEFIDIWNRGVDKTILEPLHEVILPVHWPADDSLQAELALAEAIPPFDVSRVALGQLVGAASHWGRDVQSTKDSETKMFLPRSEQHPWGTPFYILVGASFYLMCSQALGVPYKPSLLRAQLLAGFIDHSWRAQPVAAGELAIALLEKSRAEVADRYFQRLLELNVINLNVPCILAAVLREAQSPRDVLTVAMQIRGTREAAAFRQWTSEFSEAVQNGDLSQLGRFMKEVRDVVQLVNGALGLADQSGLDVSIGWGPVNANRVFGLPAILKKPLYFKRHLWFLHKMYEGIATLARVSDHVQRVLLRDLPEWLPSAIRAQEDFPARPSRMR